MSKIDAEKYNLRSILKESLYEVTKGKKGPFHDVISDIIKEEPQSNESNEGYDTELKPITSGPDVPEK